MRKNLLTKKIQKRYLEQNNEIKQSRTGPKNFDICFWETFGYYVQSFLSGWDIGH